MADSPHPEHVPFVPASQSPPEFTWPAVLAGAILGILFGASSLYLVLKVGLTVSASVPIAVLSITLFRAISRTLNIRDTTILENNIVQTTGSAGESIAFGVGVTMPALLLLGFEMDPWRVMTVSVLGGILGILMMIPLRRAFIVKQHGTLVYPEGTACAEVLVAGEKGGATAKMVFVGFFIAVFHKFMTQGAKLWAGEPGANLSSTNAAGTTTGLKGASAGGELSPELLGVGFLIGPRIASLMMAGAVLSYFVLGPLIATIGDKLNEPVSPAVSEIDEKTHEDMGLIRNMSPGLIKDKYLKYIGAGAVAAGGIIGMCRALPLIFASAIGGVRDLRSTRSGKGSSGELPRTERDMPMSYVVFGSLALVVVLACVPQLGLGLSMFGLLGAGLILFFGFLFVTVSSRLTGEIGSSSNPISGMTIATLLLVCLIFLALGKTGSEGMLTALTIAAVVCIASSNGGTTSQDLKTGYLVGATPNKQQWAILIGAITSALAIGITMLEMNKAGTHYTKNNLPTRTLTILPDAHHERPGRPYQDDARIYAIVHVRAREYSDVKPGRYLVNDDGTPAYLARVPIGRKGEEEMDRDAGAAPKPFTAPQPELFSTIIEGILSGNLEWTLVIIGALIAIAVELAGVSALPFAVGMYLPFSSSAPIFVGGMLRWVAGKLRSSSPGAEAETSPGMLLASGYIAGGTLCGLTVLLLSSFIEGFGEALDVGQYLYPHAKSWDPDTNATAKNVSLVAFALLAAVLLWVSGRREGAAAKQPEM